MILSISNNGQLFLSYKKTIFISSDFSRDFLDYENVLITNHSIMSITKYNKITLNSSVTNDKNVYRTDNHGLKQTNRLALQGSEPYTLSGMDHKLHYLTLPICVQHE